MSSSSPWSLRRLLVGLRRNVMVAGGVKTPLDVLCGEGFLGGYLARRKTNLRVAVESCNNSMASRAGIPFTESNSSPISTCPAAGSLVSLTIQSSRVSPILPGPKSTVYSFSFSKTMVSSGYDCCCFGFLADRKRTFFLDDGGTGEFTDISVPKRLDGVRGSMVKQQNRLFKLMPSFSKIKRFHMQSKPARERGRLTLSCSLYPTLTLPFNIFRTQIFVTGLQSLTFELLYYLVLGNTVIAQRTTSKSRHASTLTVNSFMFTTN